MIPGLEAPSSSINSPRASLAKTIKIKLIHKSILKWPHMQQWGVPTSECATFKTPSLSGKYNHLLLSSNISYNQYVITDLL